MGRARGATAQMLVSIEGTYGTPPAGGYNKVPFISSQLGAEQPLIDSELLGLGRAPADPTYDVVTNDGDVVIPLDANNLGLWLKLLLGAAVDSVVTANTVYQHVFSSGADPLPSASIEVGHPAVPSFQTSYGARANTFRIGMQRSGNTSATLGLIAKGETAPANASAAGSPTLLPIVRFAAATGAIKIDGVQVGEIVSADINFSNALEKIEAIRPDGEIADADPGMPMANGSLTAKFSDNALFNKATSKTPVSLEFSWTAGAYSLKIVIARAFLPKVKRPVTGPGGIQQDFNFQGSTGGAPMFVATLVNAVASH